MGLLLLLLYQRGSLKYFSFKGKIVTVKYFPLHFRYKKSGPQRNYLPRVTQLPSGKAKHGLRSQKHLGLSSRTSTY